MLSDFSVAAGIVFNPVFQPQLVGDHGDKF